MKSSELRRRYLDFFASKGHAVIPAASLIPENDPTVLFTTAGMHPLVPYLVGEKHPAGVRLTSCQKCIRTGDIDEVGDAVHLTLFEMLGNWSLGDYWKKEAIEWSFEFLTKELKIPLEKFAVSVFAGDDDAPFDAEAYEIWQKLGIAEKRIAKLPKKNNWWGPAGQTGPCGPDTEMFYWTGPSTSSGQVAPEVFDPEDPLWVEIWNDVFMQYSKQQTVSSKQNVEFEFVPLRQRNVDTGMGLDRVTAILQGKKTVFETDLFVPIIEKIKALATSSNERSERIIADHLRAATFIIGDERGVPPSNVDAGYIVRRLIRRAIREARKIGFDMVQTFTTLIAEEVIKNFGEAYPELVQNSAKILLALEKEENQFKKTLERGEREIVSFLEKGGSVDGAKAFYFYETYGFPLELIEELLQEKGAKIQNPEDFEKASQEHQEKSRTAAVGKFSGGLADHSEETTRLHTAAHLLNAALRKVLGEHVFQKGSNITAERLRFDFSHPTKMTPEQIAEVEKLVNEAITQDLPVTCEEMTVEEAKIAGAIGVFDAKYGEKVKVYTAGVNSSTSLPTGQAGSEPPFSREICGGPHANRTGELGKFKIQKEESSSAGVRRIKAVLVKN